jgi:DNA-binding NarL/FixJ family response regulator
MRILITTDAQMIGELWGEYLVSKSVSPLKVSVCSTSAIITQGAVFRPHIIFLDLHKLVLDGLAIVKTVRQKLPLAKLIVIVHGGEPQAYLTSLLQRGVAGLISLNSPLTHMAECLLPGAIRNVFVSGRLRPPGWPEGQGVDYSPNRLFLLSAKELHIGRLLASGMTSKQIGAIIGISPGTVEVHRHNMLKKLGIAKTIGLVNLWLEKEFPLQIATA